MKTSMKHPLKRTFRFWMILAAATLGACCWEDDEPVLLPLVETLPASDITQRTALSGGLVTDDGGAPVVERGLCWSTQALPTTGSGTKKTEGSGNGMFVSELKNLIPGQKYHLRAYAVNSAGTAYGNEVIFETVDGPTIIYKEDGRTVKHSDTTPIALDLNEDGKVDYTVFVELTANSRGDHLYAGMNPIGNNQIKSGPPIDEHFLNMGFLVAEQPGVTIDENLEADQFWTGDYGTLLIRHTSIGGAITYEGGWREGIQMVGIRHIADGLVNYGWIRLEFDKVTETVTLIDYAYQLIPDEPITAGAE